MKGYINVSGDYQFDNLGIVHVIIKPNAQSIHARWKGAKLQVTLPPGTSYEFVEKTLDQFRQRLENSKPKALYYIGQKLEFPEFSVEISQQSHIPDKMIMRFNPPEGLILIGNNWDMESANTMAQISKFLCRIAQRIAPDTLIPHARRVADRIGKTPLAWTISNGHRTLGHCNSKGTIALLAIATAKAPSHFPTPWFSTPCIFASM